MVFGSLSFNAPASEGRKWTVVAGGLTPDGSVWSNAFHPRVLDVTAGDVVEWRFEGFHNVAFAGGGRLPPLTVVEGRALYLNPEVAFPAGPQTYAGQGYRNSGTPADDPESIAAFRYALRFPEPGTYTYSCIVHGPAMSGTIRVHPRGERLPQDPAQALRGGREEQRATLEAGRGALNRLQPQVRGGEVRVAMVGDAQQGYSLMRFTRTPPGGPTRDQGHVGGPGPLRDPHGDFRGLKPCPTLRGATAPGGRASATAAESRVVAPTAQRAYQGGYANSGILAPLGAPGPRSYSLRFDRAGTYTYWSPVHAGVGMKGVVVVR